MTIQSNQKNKSTKKTKVQLESEISELKEMVKQLIQSNQNNKKVTDVSEIENEDELKTIPSQKLINVTSLFFGDLNLIASHGKPINFKHFGTTLPITFEDLTHICNNQRNFAEKGFFYIHSQDAIKILYLTNAYKKIISKSEIENLITLSNEQIKETYTKVTDNIKETIVDVVVHGIKDGEQKYLDRNKVDFIGSLCNKNLFQIAEDLRQYDEK